MKTVLITGASNGIGASTAKLLAKNKFNLILTYCNDLEGGERVKKECLSYGVDVKLFHLDLCDNNSIKSFVNKIDHIDILINNAGYIVWKLLKDQSFDEIDRQININLTGLIKLTKLLLPVVTEKIINIASGAGKHPHKTLSVYCATKYGLRGFTQTLALETSLKVHCVNPDMTATRMTNFVGRDPLDVAYVILNTIFGKYSDLDIDVWAVLD